MVSVLVGWINPDGIAKHHWHWQVAGRSEASQLLPSFPIMPCCPNDDHSNNPTTSGNSLPRTSKEVVEGIVSRDCIFSSVHWEGNLASLQGRKVLSRMHAGNRRNPQHRRFTGKNCASIPRHGRTLLFGDSKGGKCDKCPSQSCLRLFSNVFPSHGGNGIMYIRRERRTRMYERKRLSLFDSFPNYSETVIEPLSISLISPNSFVPATTSRYSCPIFNWAVKV